MNKIRKRSGFLSSNIYFLGSGTQGTLNYAVKKD